jgi:ADP-ribosylglycohydrolase
MRAAPFAVWSPDPAEAFRAAAECGALTHGHPSGYLPAGALAVLVQQLLHGAEVLAAVATARAVLATWPGHEETDRVLAAAIDLAALGRPSPEAIADRLGGGWIGEEALAIGLCAALVSTDLADGLRLAVNHSGDSDSTGAICGNILGARDGIAALPQPWLRELELRDVIEELTGDLLTELVFTRPPTQNWAKRYPSW